MEGQYLGPTLFIEPLNIGDRLNPDLKMSCVVLEQET